MPSTDQIKAVRFDHPESLPVSVHINAACFNHYPTEAIVALMQAHPRLFPNVDPENSRGELHPRFLADAPYTDPWGCVFQCPEDGLAGAPVRHPLADWADFDNYTPPDPETHDGWDRFDWSACAASIQQARDNGQHPGGGLRHGHTFLTLTYIRGYENLIYDMADDRPELHRLIEMVEAFNLARVTRYIDLGVEWMGYPEDLGMQRGPMLAPEMFRAYIKPVYTRLMKPARDAGAIVYMHCDGDVRDLAEDLLDCGVEVLNIQDLVNGVDWIAEHLKGRVAIDLDIDRQNIVRAGSPEDVKNHVRRCVDTLNAPEGGLMLTWGWYPGIPMENAAAVMEVFEEVGG